MSLENGAAGFRIFFPAGRMPAQPEKLFAENAAPGIGNLESGAVSGWVSGRHLLDRVITDENAYYGGYLRLSLMKAEKKVPEALLRAECRMEELAVIQAEGLAYVKRDQRSKIRKEVEERLLPGMPPSLTGISMIYDSADDLVYASAMSDKQVDALVLNFEKTTGVPLVPITPLTAARRLKSVDVDMLDPVSYSPELEDPLGGNAPGRDFLTWLWYHSETREGVVAVEGDSYSVIIEGPLTFFLEGDGAHVTLLKKGTPEVSTEAKTCLMSGKKLLQAKLTIGGEHETWSVTLDADEFIFRGLKFQKSEELDAVSRIQQRMLSLSRFKNVFLGYYDLYLSERLDPERWKKARKDIHRWVSERMTKR